MSLLLNVSRYISTQVVRHGTKYAGRKCYLWSPQSGSLLSATRRNAITVLSGLSLGGSLLVRSAWRNHAVCEYKTKRTRLLDSKSKEKEPTFNWREFFQLLWPDVWYLLGAVASALAVAVVNIQIPLMLGQLVNVVSSQADVASFLQQIREPAVKLVYMYLIQSALTAIYISLLSCVGERVAARLRTRLFSAVIKQDIAFFDKNKTGEIVNRLTADVQEFKSAFKLVISQGLRSVTQTIGCVVSLLMLSPRLTAVLVVVVPSMVGLGTLLGSGLRALSREAQAQVAMATAVADEAIGNVRTVRAFAMEDKEIELYSQEVEKSSRLTQSLGVGIGLFQGLSNCALNGVVLGTIYLGGYLMARQEIQAGDLMAFMVSTQTVQRSLAQVSLLLGTSVRGLSAGARIFEYMSLQPTMPMKGGDKIPYHSMQGEVQFRNIFFTYPTRPEQRVLKDFNLTVPGGRMVALVGYSGGGKSTVAGLLERFYDVDGGSITIDGHDIKSLDPSWLRGKAIGFINQEPVLFATSVLENIRYGYPDATDTEVIEAAKLANAHEFISGFPQGYHTVLGERGVTVSGGQKQRIAIARALIKRPTIMVLDEATSALDAESEKVVQEALDNVTKGRTVLVIAHRLSTVRNADIIAVVADGQVVEMGTHDELKKKNGLYWDLIKQQDFQKDKGWFS